MTDTTQDHTRDEHVAHRTDETISSPLPVALEAPDALEPSTPVVVPTPDKKPRGRLLAGIGAGATAATLLIATLGGGGSEKVDSETPVATADPGADEEALPFGQSPETTPETTPPTQTNVTPETPTEPTPVTTEVPVASTSTTTSPTTAVPAETGEHAITLPEVQNPVFATGEDFASIMHAIYDNEENAFAERDGNYAYYIYSEVSDAEESSTRQADNLQGTYSAEITATVVSEGMSFPDRREAVIDRRFRLSGTDEHGNPVSRDTVTRLQVVIRKQTLRSPGHPEPIEAWRIEQAIQV